MDIAKWHWLVFFVVGLALPNAAGGQSATSGTIAGVVRDTTGAVLPGVTVEASSPALIEKVRSSITDSEGQYKILDLRPGTYAVTFTLPGFNSFKREGIELTTSFTATVTAELRVGAVEETITVSGQAPVVDTQNTQTVNIISRERLDMLPSGKTVQAYGSLTLGAVNQNQDVGGNKGESPVGIAIHNIKAGDMKQMVDGLPIGTHSGAAGGGQRLYIVDSSLAEEVAVVSSGPAEFDTGGIQMNLVPKEGGNQFRTTFATSFANTSMQARNLTDRLVARGLTSGPSVRKIYDAGGSLGGPIAANRLWFFGSSRWWGSTEYQPGAYFNRIPNTLFYEPDLSRPAYSDIYNAHYAGRVTWQPLEKHKINVFYGLENSCNCYNAVSNTRAPESTLLAKFWPVGMTAVTWTYPATSHLLFQAAEGWVKSGRWARRPPEQPAGAISLMDQTSGLLYGAQNNFTATSLSNSEYGYQDGTSFPGRASMSYVTGSHAFKVGATWVWGRGIIDIDPPSLRYTFRNCFTTGCQPVSVTYYASPHYSKALDHNYGLYAQDQWTVRRLTLNLGIRYDYLHAYVPPQVRPAGPYVPSFDIARVDNVPLWKDINPRLGVAWDVFGNGKTGVKGFIGRYVTQEATGLATANNPAQAIGPSATRSWNDINSDFVPQDSELGPLSTSTFGTIRVTTIYSKEVLEGFGVRPYNWQANASIQHEL